ncbi:hypothetical protein ANO11243_020590 [Dothideomycetidae sp. 11243]|nr:hypothetical protein ANO11243_020590 [fungal sp. No.11243]
MATEPADTRVLRLAEGFNALMDEYNLLLARSQMLERGLQEAKSQFQQFVAQRGSISPEDVSAFELREAPRDIEALPRRQAMHEKWWMRNDLPMSKRCLLRTRYAVDAVHGLALDKMSPDDATSKISSEVVVNGGSSAMPSIVESPLEQDFTIPGTPSRLDCPFASLATRRLSAHAASVVSKYKPSGIMTPRSSGSRANGRLAMSKPSPLAVNGDAQDQWDALNSPQKAPTDLEASIQGSAPMCPIRFLEKSSPEDVAQYFEKHKHEIPRSHEVCVKRYQSNAESIKQLDAKYGNMVSMIQGLGEKHAPMLNDKTDPDEQGQPDTESVDRVQRWADNVSNAAQAPDESIEKDERKSHFDRPLKDVRVGESPSRPWGIQVPISALEDAEAQEAKQASKVYAGQDQSSVAMDTATRPIGKCPFAHGAPPGTSNPHEAKAHPNMATDPRPRSPIRTSSNAKVIPTFISGAENGDRARSLPGMTITGPVFIGYSPEQAAAVLRALGS